MVEVILCCLCMPYLIETAIFPNSQTQRFHHYGRVPCFKGVGSGHLCACGYIKRLARIRFLKPCADLLEGRGKFSRFDEEWLAWNCSALPKSPMFAGQCEIRCSSRFCRNGLKRKSYQRKKVHRVSMLPQILVEMWLRGLLLLGTGM